jgi:hypothetical protein
MKRIVVAVGAAAALAVPAVAVGHPTRTDRTNAAKECKAERSAIGRVPFAALYDTNTNKKNAFGKCVSSRAHDEAAERRAAHQNAAQECRDERAQDEDAFTLNYGTNHNKKNAFGKCVSGKAKQKEAEADRKDRQQFRAEHRAAKSCAAERKSVGRQPFTQKYGTKHKKRNAFGRCVSKLARS